MPSEDTAATKLARLLDTLPADDRQEITAWLLEREWHPRVALETGLRSGQELLRHPIRPLPIEADTQLVTIRLPVPQHVRLRTWCSAHGFSMAAVVRGLVERFLDQQA
jgi:hypothetical protein